MPKTWRGFIFGPYAHFLIMKFFSKNLKFFFDFLKIQRGDPLELKKSKKIFKFFEKNFIIKKCAYGLKMKPHRVLHEYFEVYGQAGKITPEAGEKRAPFFSIFYKNRFYERVYFSTSFNENFENKNLHTF